MQAMSWECWTSTDRGPHGRNGQTAVRCVTEASAVDIACVTHRPQVAQDASVPDILISWLTAILTRARCVMFAVVRGVYGCSRELFAASNSRECK